MLVSDVNDHAPTFSQSEYEFYVKEEPELGTVVGKVTASDPDLGDAGKVTYSVSFGKGAEDFSVRQVRQTTFILLHCHRDVEMSDCKYMYHQRI